MGHVDWKAGKVSGTVYHGGEELTELVTKVYKSSSLLSLFVGVRALTSLTFLNG